MSYFSRLVDAVLNRYDGAQYSSGRSLIPGAVQEARFDITRATRRELVRKSRYFEKNDALYNRIADLFELYTIGSGLVAQPASKDPEWNIAAREYWMEWEDNPDVSSGQHFHSLAGMMARSFFVDGEAFVVLTYDKKNPRIQLIDADMVETPKGMEPKEGVTIFDGVIVSPNGAPTGYYVRGNKNPISAAAMVHIFEPSRPGQYRGIPICHAVINDIHDLSDLQLLEMQRARHAADFANVIKTSTGELPSTQSLRRASVSGSTTADTSKDQYYKEAFGSFSTKTIILKNGDSAEQFKIDSPSEATRALWLNLEEKICAGIGIPRVLVYPGTMQGTVYRGALDMANAFFRARHSIIGDAIERLYKHVISVASKNGDLPNPPADYLEVTILPPRSVNVDVGRNSSAMLAELSAGATTFEDIYSPQGKDWREQFDKLKEQQDYARSIGLDLSPNNKGVTQ